MTVHTQMALEIMLISHFKVSNHINDELLLENLTTKNKNDAIFFYCFIKLKRDGNYFCKLLRLVCASGTSLSDINFEKCEYSSVL